ncbi:hypothetical protein BOX15_Mlig033948g1 [Macrostomum lignano]|uniref:Uncharacterized protein n=1 Tax=Macrostomum lignano TaxID=282301 RepID=A0A267GZ20_9PLAT|nr:hypothetical protein BOX15_Mlig033948g1 [Macrostomum lignano]
MLRNIFQIIILEDYIFNKKLERKLSSSDLKTKIYTTGELKKLKLFKLALLRN